jgi:hypothetical protein
MGKYKNNSERVNFIRYKTEENRRTTENRECDTDIKKIDNGGCQQYP